MESVLHIEPIIRSIKTPLTVGHTEYLSFGDKSLGEDEDYVGSPAAILRLGCPLESIDVGSVNNHVPLVKTIEYMPDPDRSSGFVYLETVHYFKDLKYLIPIRTKIHSGTSSGMRVSHLPSLDFARKDISGDQRGIKDPRAEIITDLLYHDAHFKNNPRHPMIDWIRDDLVSHLSRTPVTDIKFDSDRVGWMISDYIDEVKRTPYDLNSHHLKRVMNKIGIEHETFPLSYFSPDVLYHQMADVRRRVLPHNLNFKSYGRIPVEKIPRIDYNPFGFQPILTIIDRLPLTDCNIDVIVNVDNSIGFVHEHIVQNRLAIFADNDLGSFSAESLLAELLDEATLKLILGKFLKYHSAMNDDLKDLINSQPIKLKFIKTITDEALILLYGHDTTSNAEPLCGVYFDIALQSLAPLSIVPESIFT